ncbi:hypothetical protein F383_25388 [Gossypium arboreum]|uniref:Uncharacterized protein n=1 Tax=Gossypium arboreum TaxID=29729 RepID=A0A0B0MQG0_GOSAR|nr:hypothetical protein F383_25388 [Gossypium arboreum]
MGCWHCMTYVIIRVSYSNPNGSTGNDKLRMNVKSG